MKARLDLPSGVSGILSPLLRGRNDLQKFQSGAADILNMVVLPEGARTRRPGTRFVMALADETTPATLLPFDAGDGDSALLVFNGGKMQVVRDAAPVLSGPARYEIATPFTSADQEKLRWTQSLDVMFLAWGGKPKRLSRYGETDWVLDDFPFAPGGLELQNTDSAKTIQASATTGTVTLTASFNAFEAGHVGSIWRIDEPRIGDIPVWKLGIVYAANFKVRWKGRIYLVTTMGDSGDYAPEHEDGEVKAGGASGQASGCVFKFLSFDHGYVKITAVASATSATATVLQELPPACAAAPSYRWWEGAWCDKNGWPDVVTIVDQSLLFARRNRAWLSETTDITSFAETTADDSAVSFRLFSPDGKAVDFQWALNAGSLLMGASSGEWVIRGPSSYDRITAANSRGFLQSSEGSAPQQPVSVAGGAVFIGASRAKLVFAKFDFVAERIEIQDFTTYARPMLRKEAMQLAWQNDPHHVLWVRLGDGTLAAVTLRPDQEVIGWHRHALPGAFVENICCIRSADNRRDELYVQTRRVIDGVTRRYIERLEPFFEAESLDAPTLKGAWFVDCGITYSGAPTALLTGLDHLEGQTVRVVCPSGDLGLFTVTSGAVTLPRQVSEAVVGLSVSFRTKSLPLDIQAASGSTRPARKRASHVTLLLHESAGGLVSCNGATPEPISHETPEGVGDYLALTTGPRRVALATRTGLDLTLTISGDNGLPFTLLAMSPEAEFEGG